MSSKVTHDRLKLTWEAPTVDGGSPVTGYSIRMRSLGQPCSVCDSDGWRTILSNPDNQTNTTNWLFALAPSRVYQFKIVAHSVFCNNRPGQPIPRTSPLSRLITTAATLPSKPKPPSAFVNCTYAPRINEGATKEELIAQDLAPHQPVYITNCSMKIMWETPAYNGGIDILG